MYPMALFLERIFFYLKFEKKFEKIRLTCSLVCLDPETSLLSDWVLQQQVMVFTFNVISFKNRTANIKEKYKCGTLSINGA